jgi:hypothetical protein
MECRLAGGAAGAFECLVLNDRGWEQRIAVMPGFEWARNVAIMIGHIEQMHRIREAQFAQRRLGGEAQVAPARKLAPEAL